MRNVANQELLDKLVSQLDDIDEGVREAAVIALAKTNTFRAMAVLEQIVSEDKSVRVRYVAKKALYVLKKRMSHDAKRQGPTVIMGVKPANVELEKFRAILTGHDNEKKEALLKVILRHKLKGAMGLLIEAAAVEKEPRIRSQMVIVMGVIGDEGAIKHVATFLYDDDPRVRANAIEALEHIGSPAAFPMIINSLSDDDNRIRANAVKALKHCGSVNVHAILHKMLQSSEVWMRDSATYALGAMARDADLQLLLHALKDPEVSVRQRARNGLELLARRGNDQARHALQSSNQNKEPGRLAPRVWSQLAELMEVPNVKSRLESSDPSVRLEEIRRIVTHKDTSRLEDIKKVALLDEDAFIRAVAVSGLGNFGETSVVDTLRSCISSSNDRIRANAIEALGTLLPKLDKSDPQFIASKEDILKCLQDSSGRCRANAIIALKDERDVNIIESLQQMIASGNNNAKKSALYALADLNRDEFLPFVEKLFQDKEPQVKKNAANVLRLMADDGCKAAAKMLKKLQGD